jgi:hypothetical protein
VLIRLLPLYAIPIVLAWDHLNTLEWRQFPSAGPRPVLFLLSTRGSRVAAATALGFVAVTVLAAGYRRSDAHVRALVHEHRDTIRAAAARYAVDPRLVAAIVYVTHRDQLSPFRATLERLVMTAWATDGGDEYGGNQFMLNEPLDISVGLAQIKPRTAQTASLLATGRVATDLPRPASFSYMRGEPAGQAWVLPVAGWEDVRPPFPVPTDRHVIVEALLDARTNIETCALILGLYQRQWEQANPAWSLRGRPDILATLHQIGFARSKPHGAPRSNAFGSRVRAVVEQPWLADLFRPAA